MRRAGKHSLFPSSDAGKSVASRSPLLRGGADGCGYVDELPRSILLDVISRLDGPSVAKLGMTCRRLREETRSGKVWRALAYAQESSGLCRDDLVTQDFTWRHLFAWRRHVLSHCDRGMNRLAVADAQRVLTCDPVEGGGRCYTIHETTQTVLPNLLTWSRRGELLAVAQESAEGCEVILAAPPAMMRRRTLARRGARDRRDDGGGDEDSTAAGVFSPGGSALGGGGGGGSSVMGAAVGSPVDPARKQKPSAINVLTLPIQNPVFLAFAPCGTRLAMLNARRSGDEFSLHSLDLAVALSSLYGAADGRSGAFAPRDMSREACESLSLMKVSKELSFAFGPRSLDVLALVDGVGVAKLAPVQPANRLATRAELSDGTPRHVGGHSPDAHGPHHAKEGQGTLSDPPSTEEEDPWDAPEDVGAGAGPRMAPFVPRDAFFAEDEGNEGEDVEVSSVAENLWWRRSVNAATEGYRAGVETMARGLRWATGGWVGGASRSRRRGRDARGGVNAARRRQRAGGVHGEGRAIKRARLTREATAGGVVAGASRARNIPARRKVQPGDVVSFRDDAVHAIQLDGLSHIVQWIPPRPARLGEATDPNPDGHWLVPASYPDAMPPAVYLALVPATATPTPDEIRGSPAERAEAARRSMIGLPPVVTLTGPRAASIAADRAASRARDVFAPGALERRVAAELSPPAVYDELHAVVPTLASAAPGGRVVCWSDDEALWARRFDARDGNAGPLATAPRAVIELQSCGFGANADPGGGNPVLHHVQAMQWSPSGRRLLVLLAVHVTTAQHVFPMHQWVVWDPPPSWLEDGDAADRDADEPGTLSRGRWHVPSLAFSQDCLPIFEQYAQTHSLWNPGEGAIAYPTRNEVENVDQVEVQHFPKREAQPGTFPSAVRQRDGMPFVMQPVPPAVVVCEGSFVVWSPC